MNNKLVVKAYNVLCIVLVALSILMLFTGGVAVTDKDAKKTLKKEMKQYSKNLESFRKDIDPLEEALDNSGVDISPKKALTKLNDFITPLMDAEITPFEIGKNGPSVVSLCTALDDASKTSLFSRFIPSEVVEEIVDTKGSVWFGIILFYATLIAGIVTLILHILGKRPAGITFAVLQLVLLITLGIFVSKLNDFFDFEYIFDTDEGFGLMASPVWGFILALLSALLWYFKDLILKPLGFNPVLSNTAGNASAAQNTCPSCGKVLNPGALFCTGCGAKFTAPTPATPAPAPTPASDNGMKTCPSCGASVPADSDFCTQCGTKLS